MNFPIFLASRLQLGHTSPSSTSTGIRIAVTGIAMATVVMMLSVSVMLGFKHQIRDKIIGFDSQITLSPRHNTDPGEDQADLYPLTLTAQLSATLRATLPEEAQYTLTTTLPSLLKTESDFQGIMLKSHADTAAYRFIAANIVRGQMPDFAADSTRLHIVISTHTANLLHLDVGDKTDAYFLQSSSPRVRRLTVAALFDTRFEDYDKALAYCNPLLLNRLAGLTPEQGSALEITGLDTDRQIDITASALTQALLHDYYSGKSTEIYRIDNVHQSAAAYFNWLDLLDTNVAVILALMCVVGCFTLISSLFIIILERVSMIGILKAIGATDTCIRKTFILVAQRLVARGLIAGNIIALAIMWAQYTWQIIPLDPQSYYLSSVPVEFSWPAILAINIGIVVITALTLILPTHIITTLSPSKSIRFE